ncbi:MAG: type II CAAX prenyl endopeptidase Rce1 family protein [Promethearchaeota archaeon]
MRAQNLSIFSLSKIATKEILVEEQVEQLETSRFRYFTSFLSNQKSLRRRILASKIFGAILFGILPIIPLLTYFEVLSLVNEGNVPIERILFAGSVLFGIYFLFQFFNFFLMAMLSTMKILSGRIFDWFETLPISRTKLKQLIFLTIIRTLDIPLIAITIAFPIIMLIGTQNIIIFLICFGVSTLDTIFSLALLILFSERLNRILNINNIGDKKTHFIRLSNLSSYIIIVIGSVFLIQWALNSIDEFFNAFASSQYPTLIVLILSLIPYPIAPGYLISTFISPKHIPTYIWFNILVGFFLFLILVYLIYQQSIKGIKKSSYSKLKIDKKADINKTAILKKQTILKIRNPVWAFIRKDIIIATRNLKSFLSFVMPIVIGFVFILTYNSINVGGINPFEIDFILNMFVIIGFNLVVSGMIIHGILNIEESGTSIFAALPIIPRDQAKSKLYLMLLIQTITVLAPSLMYLGQDVFLISLGTALLALPLILLILIVMFEIKIYLFGKLKNYYVIEDVKPENKNFKWILIYIAGYSIYLWTLTFSFISYGFQDLISLVTVETLFVVIGIIVVFIIFIRFFPLKRLRSPVKERKIRLQFEGRQTWFTLRPWISIIVILVISLIITYLNYLANLLIFPINFTFSNSLIRHYSINLFILNIIYIIFLIFINQLSFGIPYGKMSIKNFLNSTIFGEDITNTKKVILSIIIAILVLLINLLIFFIFNAGYEVIPLINIFYVFIILFVFTICFWQEFIFRALIFPFLSSKFKKWKAIILNCVIYMIILIFYLFLPIAFFPFPIYLMSSREGYRNIPLVLIELIYYFFISIFYTYVYFKTKNLIIVSSISLIFSLHLNFLIISMLSIPFGL